MSGKAGVSWPCQEGSSDPLQKFFAPGSKLSWHWNWNKNYQSCLPGTSPNLKIDAEFVPMIFAPDHLKNGVELQEGYRMVMGFNEPDHGDAAVAYKCSPKDAATAWSEIAKLRRDDSNVKLASPAVAFNIDWLREFLNLIPADTQPDFLTVHLYTTSFDDFVRRIEAIYREFQLPIVLNEFAMHSFDPSVPPAANQQQVHDFMGQATKWLDETGYIHKYSWFGAVRDQANLHRVNPYNRLMDANGELTPLGWQYVHGGHD